MISLNVQQINELIDSGRLTEAASVIKTLAGELILRGEYSPLLELIPAIPIDFRANDDDLGFIYAQCLVHTGEVHQAGSILTGVINKARIGNNWLILASALIWRSAAHRLAGNLENALTDAESALKLRDRDGVGPMLNANAEFRLGNALLDMGHLDEAIEHLNLATKWSADGFDLDITARIQNSLGAAYLRLGDIAKAAVHLEYAREGWGKTGNSGALAGTMNSQAYLCQRLGQTNRAKEILNGALTKARDCRSIRLEASILIALGIVERDLDDFEAALATLKSALNVARDATEKNFVSWAKAEIGDTYRRMGHYSLAVQALVEAVTQAKEQNQAAETNIFNVLLGISKFMHGERDEGLDLLSTAAELLEKGGDRDALARCTFFLACCHFNLKNYDQTIIFLKKTQALAEILGYHEFLATDGEDFPMVIHFADSKHLGGKLFHEIQHRIKEKLEARHGKKIASIASEVEAFSLGSTKVIVFSKPVEEDQWRCLRAKELFFFLLCHPRQTAEQIMTALWPDAAPDRALSNLHTNLYRARRATSPGIITVHGGRYQLNQELKICFDMSEFLNLTVPRRREEDSSVYCGRLESALKLYQGPFMDGFQAEWIEELRRNLEDKYLRASAELAHEYQAGIQHHKAIPVLEKAIKTDAYQDELYSDLIESHIALGDRLSALKVYQQYKNIVLADIGSEPPARLTQLLKPLLT